MDTFLAFLWNSNWYEWCVSEGPGVEFKVRFGTRAKDFPLYNYRKLKNCCTE